MVIHYEKSCEFCGKIFVKNKSDKLPTPRFCSNNCKHSFSRKSFVVKICEFCGKEFSVKNFYSYRKTCSKSCGGKLLRSAEGKIISEIKQFTCQNCGILFLKRTSKRNYKYCSKLCVLTSAGNKVHQGRKAQRDRLMSSGKFLSAEEADKIIEITKQKYSIAMTKRNSGSTLAVGTRQRIANSLKQRYFSGELTSPNISNNRNYVQGFYKNIWFRSSLEFAFMLKMESLGHVLGVDVIPEPKDKRVKYVINSSEHVYVPDFYIVPIDLVVEIKNKSSLENKVNLLKFQAAKEKFGEKNYKIYTQDDLKGFLKSRDEIQRLIKSNTYLTSCR